MLYLWKAAALLQLLGLRHEMSSPAVNEDIIHSHMPHTVGLQQQANWNYTTAAV